MTESTTAAERSFRDRLRIDTYLLRLDWHLEGSLPGAERRAAIASLRQDLTADPRPVRRALDDLGPPRILAARYADEETQRPLWSTGVIIATVALIIYWAVFLCFTGGMLAAVDSAGVGRAQATFLFVQVEAFSTSDSIGAGWSSGVAWLVVPLVIITLAFLLGARTWRAVPRHR